MPTNANTMTSQKPLLPIPKAVHVPKDEAKERPNAKAEGPMSLKNWWARLWRQVRDVAFVGLSTSRADAATLLQEVNANEGSMYV